MSLTRRTLWLGAVVALLASISMTAVAGAHSRHRSSAFGHHHARYGATGFVTANTGTTLTVRRSPRSSITYAITSSTQFVYADGTSASSSDAQPGRVVTVQATAPTTAGANPVATRVVIRLATIDGLVQSNDAGTLTVSDGQGFNRVVRTSSPTTCRQGGVTIACAAIVPGSFVVARGHVDPDGTSLDATSVKSYPPSS